MAIQDTDIDGIKRQRQRDQLRLLETRLDNLEQQLKKLQHLKFQFARRHDIETELATHTRRVFQLTKESAIMSVEAEEMQRFETFESIITPFLRMEMLKTEAEEYRRMGQELHEQLHDNEENVEQLRKRMSELIDNDHEVRTQHHETCSLLGICNFLDGQITALTYGKKLFEDRLADVSGRLEQLREKKQENQQNLQVCQDTLEQFKTERHQLESHEIMLSHSEVVLAHLKRFRELQHEIKKLHDERNESSRNQSQENELLGRIYSEYNDIKQQIQTLQDEANVHRTSIRGMVSFDVQERVLKLKSRLQMLLSAKSLWRRIASGYARISEKTQLLNTLRLDIEHDLKSEQELTVKVKELRRLTHEKEHALNMSKSQNVIELRGDLREGEACTVCGATHHPFHSDTILDQAKLLSDIRGEYETLKGELDGQCRQLDELHDKLTKAIGQQIAEQQNLEVVQLRQDEDVKEWEVYAPLDPTFFECLPSTNAEGRMATIRQLLDNAERDLATAQQNLSDYMYHSEQIDNLSEKIAVLEEKKDETITRMGEVNTACQVLASLIDHIDDRYKSVQEHYHQLYDQLGGEITVPDWYSVWEGSHDDLRSTITTMATKMEQLDSQIPQKQTELEQLTSTGQSIQYLEKSYQADSTAISDILRELSDKLEEYTRQRESLFQTQPTAQVLDESLDRCNESRHNLDRVRNEIQDAIYEQKSLSGALDAIKKSSELLDTKESSQRSSVDSWMHMYNANHPPVQYSELSQLLTKDIDWNQRRLDIRKNQMDSQMENMIVKQLQAEIVSLEMETGQLTTEQAQERQAYNNQQIEEVESSIRDTMLQIAHLHIELGIQ